MHETVLSVETVWETLVVVGPGLGPGRVSNVLDPVVSHLSSGVRNSLAL